MNEIVATGIQIGALYITPMMAGLVWLWVLFRLKRWILAVAFLGLGALISMTAVKPVLAVVSHPYLVGVLVFSAWVNVLVLRRMAAAQRGYLVAVNLIFLGMMAALYLWALVIRQRELYFYQQSAFGEKVWLGVLMIAGVGLFLLFLEYILYRSRLTN